MKKELLKYVVIGIVAGAIAYVFTVRESISIKVTEMRSRTESYQLRIHTMIYINL